MEDKETQKRKYKKHKEGFKIAIVHKLNTRLKSHSYGEDHSLYYEQLVDGQMELYPLYVEVRAKRQISYFRSMTTFLVAPEHFDSFKEDRFAQSFILQEKTSIENHLSLYIEEKGEGFQINDWFVKYRAKQHFERILIGIIEAFENCFRRVFQERNLDIDAFFILISQGDNLETMYNLALILKGLGIQDFNSSIEAVDSFGRIYGILSNRLPYELYESGLIATINFREALTFDNLFSNSVFEKKVAEIDSKNLKTRLIDDIDYLSKFFNNEII